MMIKKILVAVDGSEHAERALDYALDLAEKCGAEVTILTVVPPVVFPMVSEDPDMAPLFAASEIDRISKRMRSSFEKVLEESLTKARSKKPSLKVSTKLAEGHPADKILKISEEISFNLIVMGSRGLHGISEFLLGSTTHRVADHCKKPLLIVK